METDSSSQDQMKVSVDLVLPDIDATGLNSVIGVHRGLVNLIPIRFSSTRRSHFMCDVNLLTYFCLTFYGHIFKIQLMDNFGIINLYNLIYVYTYYN